VTVPDSQSNAIGWVLNPPNLRLRAGESSGGEGELRAISGAMGAGTDVGGSVGIVAMRAGLYGVQPGW